MTLLAVKALSLTLGSPLFSDLCFTLHACDRLALVAANGRGKSSLLRCLAGALDPTSGEITRARGLTLALVAQDVPPDLSPLTMRAATLAALPQDSADEAWRADIVLDDLAVPTALRDQPVGQLSGGWQRTTLLACAAITEPDLYLLDEPTNHLDIEGQDMLQTALCAHDATCLLVSHDRGFVRAMGTRFWQSDGRQLIETDDPETFFQSQIGS